MKSKIKERVKNAVERLVDQPDDVYVAANGRRIHRRDVEDPERPGYVRGGLWPLPPSAWLAASHFGLRNHRGDSLALAPTAPDPLAARVLRQSAPPEA